MPDNSWITCAVEQGVIVLTLAYSPEQLVVQGASDRWGKELVASYDEMLEKNSGNPSCVVKIESDIAGSPLVRALFDLYRAVIGRRGDVIVANYPDDYIDSLTSLGLTDFSEFSLSRSVRDAVGQLRQK